LIARILGLPRKAAGAAEIGAGFKFAADIGSLFTGGSLDALNALQLGQYVGMPEGEGGGFVGGFGGAG
jgi:hypothetical protein